MSHGDGDYSTAGSAKPRGRDTTRPNPRQSILTQTPLVAEFHIFGKGFDQMSVKWGVYRLRSSSRQVRMNLKKVVDHEPCACLV